ncbi:MAG TPA: RcnB family protein [Burkholderiales bacterium]|nr:RcnB family protein [Burkholderiales bacterium]
MIVRTIISTAIVVSLTAAGLAFAQDNRDRNTRAPGSAGDARHGEYGNEAAGVAPKNNREYSQQDRHIEARQQPNGPQDRRYADGNRARDGRGAGPDHQFHRGERLPREYHNKHYVVDDWRGHHLSAPPRGYHWVQTGNDYVLVAIASGLIAQILLGN